ncbi:MAG: diguanylate cyclase [Geminicoccaceae bacterium]|nr:diguanylate cyclase [Geminicoccaceae bacterium]
MSLSSRILLIQRADRPLADIAARLESWSWGCTTCTDGDEMVALLDKWAFDVILLEPGVEDSMGIVSWLKARPETRRIPLVIVAIEEPSIVAAHALALGADDVLVLPVGDAELDARTRALSRLRVMELERMRREAVLREFGIAVEESGPGMPAIDKIGILLVGPAGQEQVQVVTALGGAAAIAYAETPESALERLRRYDLEVAVVTGAEDPDACRRLLEAIRADGALFHLPVMLIARSDLFPDRAEPFAWGTSDVLFHPFHPEVLRLRVQGWVRQQRLRRRLRGQLIAEALPPTVDRLTRLYGHGFLHRYLEHQIEAARSLSGRLTVATFAIAGMSRINREMGFVTGDAVLREVGMVIGRLTRAEDLAARYDGDRFCAVLDGATAEDALLVGRRIAQTAAELRLHGGRAVRIELRVGVAELMPEDDASALIRRAFAGPPERPLLKAS